MKAMSCLSTFAMACPTCQCPSLLMLTWHHFPMSSSAPTLLGIHLTWMGSLMPPNPSSLLKPLLAASPTIPASMTMVGLSATPLLLTVLLKPALTILVLLSLLLQLRFLPFPRPLFPSFLRPHFGWVPTDCIKATLDATTQYYRATMHYPFRKHFKSCFPAANVNCIPEWFATNTIFSDVPAHDDGIPGHGGCTMLQLYGGVNTHFLAGYPLSSEASMPETLEDFIRDHSAMKGLMSDNAKSEVSRAMKNIQRLYMIKDCQSEPHYQHQNLIERCIQDVKRMSNNIMDRIGCPTKFWLLCTLFTISLLNHLVNVNGAIPMSLITSQVTDISAFLTFHFWEEVFFEEPDSSKRLGCWVGIAAKHGDALMYLVLSHDTEQVVVRSNVHHAKDPLFPNIREHPPAPSGPLSLDRGEVSSRPVLHSLSDALDVNPSNLELPKFSPDELLGLSFLRDTDNGQCIRAKVMRKILDRDAENHQNIKFLVQCGEDEYEENSL